MSLFRRTECALEDLQKRRRRSGSDASDRTLVGQLQLQGAMAPPVTFQRPHVRHLVYYVPTVPTVQSTVRYAHASVLPEYADRAELVTESPAPTSVAERYDDCHVLNRTDKKGNVLRARRIVSDLTDDDVYVGSFQYAPVLAGALSDVPWVADVYDDPLQYALNNPRTYHELSARIDKLLLSRADRVAAVLHPAVPGIGGDHVRYVPNDVGFPTSLVDPDTRPADGPLRAVWVGSPQLDRGIDLLLDALDRVDVDLSVDVLGDASVAVRERVHSSGLEDVVELHGAVEHEIALEAIEEADIGLCVLPPRRDWKYSYPVKVREYLAAGTVPVLSEFPSFQQSAREAGYYVPPTAAGLAEALRELAQVDPSHLVRMKERARERAETYPAADGRHWWARQALSGVAR